MVSSGMPSAQMVALQSGKDWLTASTRNAFLLGFLPFIATVGLYSPGCYQYGRGLLPSGRLRRRLPMLTEWSVHPSQCHRLAWRMVAKHYSVDSTLPSTRNVEAL